MPTDKPVSWNCATPPTAWLLTAKPLVASTVKVTVPPAGLEEEILAVRFTAPPEVELYGTFTLEAVRVMDVGTSPPPPSPPADPAPQPTEPRNNNRQKARAVP